MGKKTATKPAAKAAGKAKPVAKSVAKARPAAAGKDTLDEKSRDVKGKIIEDFDTFKAEWEKNSKDPAQSVLFFLIGVYNYAKGNEKVGEAQLTSVLSEKNVWADASSPSGFKIPVSDRKIVDNLASLPGAMPLIKLKRRASVPYSSDTTRGSMVSPDDLENFFPSSFLKIPWM